LSISTGKNTLLPIFAVRRKKYRALHREQTIHQTHVYTYSLLAETIFVTSVHL